MVLNTACLDDLEAIKKLFDTAKEQILTVSRRELKDAIIEGRVIWQDGVALVWRGSTRTTYYGIPVGLSYPQILQLIASNPGNGSARRVMEAFIERAGWKHPYLLVKSDNERAIRFYKRLGFKEKKELNFATFNSLLMVHDDQQRPLVVTRKPKPLHP